MKTPTEAFSQSIKSFLNENPNSGASKLIMKVSDKYNRYGTYYGMFDALGGDIGLQFIAVPVFDHKKEDYDGYWPYLKYDPFNKLGKEPQKIPLISEKGKPLKLDKCYELLAREFVYELMGNPLVIELIEKK